MVSVQLHIQGMSCQGCAGSVERRLKASPGVRQVAVDLAGGTADVSFDDLITNAEALGRAIESLGFTVVHTERQQAI